MTEPRKNAGNTPRGRPFEKGNPGKPTGSRHKVTQAIDALLDGEAETLTRKAIELAKSGDMVAMRLCLDRICPPRRDRPVTFALPKIETAADAKAASAAILQAVAEGELTPDEAAGLSKLLADFTRVVEVVDLELRIETLQQRGPR